MSTANGLQWTTQELLWRNLVAAFWSIAWPGLVASFFVLSLLVGPEISHQRALVLSVASATVFLLSQAAFVPRLYRKKYRLFRIEIERNAAGSKQSLSTKEITQVAVRLLGPQAVFIIANFLFVNWLSLPIGEQQAKATSTLLLWARFLVVGLTLCSMPYALRIRDSSCAPTV